MMMINTGILIQQYPYSNFYLKKNDEKYTFVSSLCTHKQTIVCLIIVGKKLDFFLQIKQHNSKYYRYKQDPPLNLICNHQREEKNENDKIMELA